jgi:ribonuclease-3
MNQPDFRALEQALDYKFQNAELLIEALTHRSHFHEFSRSRHNERLEFLGDAVIDLCVTETLLKLCPDMDEGVLSKMRSQLVSESALSRIAKKLQLGEALRLGRGEELSGGRVRDSLLADSFEAVCAAVYLDGGLSAAQKLIWGQMESSDLGIEDWSARSRQLLLQDFKSRLQELCQAAGYGAPVYRCVGTMGPDHAKSFVMAVIIDDREIIRRSGSTKKEASQLVAQDLLKEIEQSENDLVRVIGPLSKDLNRKDSLV